MLFRKDKAEATAADRDRDSDSTAAPLPRLLLARRWRTGKAIVTLFCLEFCLTVATLALYGIADPNTYRTKLWADGAANGFNSDPLSQLYAAANHKSIKTPLVWSQFVTSWNVVISVLSMFILLAKSVMFVMHILYPALSTLVHAVLVALYAVSLHAQVSPDMSDPAHPQPGAPWYITKPCSVVHEASNLGYCKQAKASLAVTVVMVALFTTYALLSLYSSVPSTAERQQRQNDAERGQIRMYTPETRQSRPLPSPTPAHSSQQWGEKLAAGYMRMPRTPGTADAIRHPSVGFSGAPAPTPRTVAFQTLDGSVAKEVEISRAKGKERTRSGSGGGSGSGLLFRDQYGGPDGR